MKKLLFSAVTLDVGGIETALVTLLNYLSNLKEKNQNKYQITLVLEKKQGLFLDSINPNIEIIEYTPNNNKNTLIRKVLNLIKQTIFKIKYKNKFDFSCCYATYSKPASFVARTASDNCVLWVHSQYMQIFNNNINKYINFFNEIKYKKFKKIIFVSNDSKNVFINTVKNNFTSEEYKNIRNKVCVINNLINYNSILEKSEKEINDIEKKNIFTFIYVGRQTEKDKKITRIIESSKRLKEDELEFRVLLVGDGIDTNKYKQLVEKYNLKKQLTFLGKKQNPYPYFKIADSLLLTSEYEGFPVVFIEAMILDLPIITTNVSDSNEIIKDKFGVVVEKNIDSIYNAMKNAIKNGVKIKEKFDYKQYNLQIQKQIEKIIIEQ